MGFVVLLFCLCVEVVTIDVLLATHDFVRWQGRTLRDEGAGLVKYSWAGVSFHFRAIGVTGAGMQTSSDSSTFSEGSAVLHVYTNGKFAHSLPLQSWTSGVWVTLVAGLPRGDYNISGIYIPIANLPSLYAHKVHAFSVDGSFASPGQLDPQQRRIHFYGDSITAGAYIDSETCTSDWSGTYGKLLCDDFSANCTCAAIPWKGIFHNCCDDNNEAMNVLGLRVLPADSTTAVSPEYYEAAGKPHAVLINLGTNDWGYVGNHRSRFVTFVMTYTAFVINLLKLHGFPGVPAPVFFLGVGPVTDSYGAAVQSIIETIKALGVEAYKISFVAPLDKCQHPPYSSHVLMYQQARAVMSSALGWDILV